MAALLHVKFTEDFPALVDRACIEKQHSGGSVEYRVYQEGLRRRPDLSLLGPCSRRYEAPQSLVAAGLIEPIDWSDRRPRRRWNVAAVRHRLHATARAMLGPGFREVRRRWLALERW
jgi:hypothetical protein